MRPARVILVTVVCGLLAGCGLGRSQLDQALLNYAPSDSGSKRLAEQYPVRFPDVIEVQIAGRPDLCGQRPVRVDGRIELSPGDLLRIEGKTVLAIARLIADHHGLDPDKVRVRVEAYNSQRVFVQGEVSGETRAVSYIGPETVLELLQRTGGLSSGAAPGEIQVVRARIAEGKAPEVFDVDLPAILLKNDRETNIRLRPSDQVHVGQRRSCSIEKCMPPWFRPFFARLCGLKHPEKPPHEPLRDAIAERRASRYSATRQR